ncbi:MAG: CocE/NonD family hydrolase C-terminal non-catalytic domain-containing protein, partial [Pseudomonadota bacterium]
RLSLRCDRPRGQVILRLCDVAPNGASALISHGMLDLRHADGHADPRDVEPGETLEIEVALDHAAYRLPQGHRLRLAVSAGYWPFLWPEADAFALTLTAGALEIRIRPTASGDEWRFQTAEAAPPRPARRLAPASDGKRVETDLATGLRRIVIEADHGEVEDLSTGLIAGSAVKEVWSIVEGDPASARVDIAWRRSLRRGGWRVATEARLSQWSEDGGVRIDGRLETFEGDAPRFARDFSTFAPRR